MGSKRKKTILRRYSDLPSLLHLLQSKKLTLLSPKWWDDKNDSHYIDAYKREKELESVLALCFTEASETYHHWRVFSSGPSGICIEFDKDKLLSELKINPGITAKEVLYKKISDLRIARPHRDDYPFLKRYPFRDEKEFRVIYEDKLDVTATKEFDLDLSCISRLSVNPWMPKTLFGALKDVIRGIDGCKHLTIIRTTLVDNEEWKNFAKD